VTPLFGSGLTINLLRFVVTVLVGTTPPSSDSEGGSSTSTKYPYASAGATVRVAEVQPAGAVGKTVA
jgi:hypothetical protein